LKPFLLVDISIKIHLYYFVAVHQTYASYYFVLKELNRDLTQKLESQTQRLELLTSQIMANENVLAKPVDTRSINDATMYADEGDEVIQFLSSNIQHQS
jgi:hypothetical protein